MNSSRMLRTMQATVILLFLSPWNSACGDSEQAAEEKPVDYQAMIDALANRVNKPPVLLRVSGDCIPVFFDDYDYDEHSRVRDVVQTLTRNAGDDLWPHLVAHINDDRYAFTYDTVGVDSDYAITSTVGGVCRLIAKRNVDWPCKKHMPASPRPKGAKRFSHIFPEPIELRRNLQVEFTAWCEKRRGKLLYELQIEQCQYVLDRATEIEGLSADQHEKYVKDIKEQIADLDKTRVPVVRKEFQHRMIIFKPSQIEKYRIKYGSKAQKQLDEKQ